MTRLRVVKYKIQEHRTKINICPPEPGDYCTVCRTGASGIESVFL
jgi:hypothetical protein